MSNLHICPTCHTKSNLYWSRLSPGLVGILVKFRHAIKAKGENSIHLQRDMTGRNELSKTQYANCQKLRFHGLIAHDKKAGAGYWLLTRRGRAFLDGELPVPRRVQTLNNHVVDHDEVHVTVEDVLGDTPYFDDIQTIESEPVPLEVAQGRLPL
jgi:hypothetical protein